MGNKIKVKTTIIGTLEIDGKETDVKISHTSVVTDGDYIDAIRNGVINSISRAIVTGFETLKMTAQEGGGQK
ncbi:hypothetical protein [Hymenobacter baengnokdamensis]|uniref:hypothetical protein n=1 Tax=Hymenobacter baengnokdamensis TaxID=2615203 RepID=UPI0012465152|nr:hypothetical protein [Hymenobacter baengnokdamensis]